MSFQPRESGSPMHTHIHTHAIANFFSHRHAHTYTLNTNWGSVLPVFAGLIVVFLIVSVVLIQGAELGAGSRKAVFFISTLEAGQNALTKQILPHFHLDEKVETQINCILELLSFSLWECLLFCGIIICDALRGQFCSLTRSIDEPREYLRLTLRSTCKPKRTNARFKGIVYNNLEHKHIFFYAESERRQDPYHSRVCLLNVNLKQTRYCMLFSEL